MHFKRRLTAISSIALLFALISAPPIALAHERRTLGAGKYDVVVGWDIEPAYVGEKNAASIRIARVGTNPAEPVTGVDKTLKVDISIPAIIEGSIERPGDIDSFKFKVDPGQKLAFEIETPEFTPPRFNPRLGVVDSKDNGLACSAPPPAP